MSLSQSVSLSISDSLTFSHDPGACSAEYSIFPLFTNTIPYSEIIGYPEDKVGDVFHFSDLPAVKLQEDGFSVSVRLQRGYFFPNVDKAIAFKIFGKSALLASVLVPAEQAVGLENDFKSDEGHGINDYWPKAEQQYFVFRRSSNLISLEVKPLRGYRIAKDEWIIINFYFNATAPLGCATKTAVIRATAFRPAFFVPIVGAMGLFVMTAGIIAAATQRTIPTSHHASMIAILAWMHYAQEDGTELPLALSPFQLSFGTSKYRYVRGALFGNAGIILVIFLGQHIAMWYVSKRKGYDKAWAARAVLYPRLVSSVTMHFAGAILFSCGRNFGNQTSSSFIVTSLVLLFTGWIMIKTHRINVSSTMLFQAEFISNEIPSAHPLLPSKEVVADINDTFLQTMRSRLTLQPIGYWKSTDPADSFVERYGMVMESYKPKVKYWMLIESIDVAITALLSVFDNYTPFLAFYQFGLTLLVKLGMLIFLIWKRPLLTHQSSVAMLANYGGQVIGYLALAIGSLRYEIRGPAEIVQGVGCAIALGGLFYDVLVHVTTSVFQFIDLYKRNKDFDENDETTERRLELTQNFRRAKTAAELEDIERVEKLNFWFQHFCTNAREAEEIARKQEQSAEDVISTKKNAPGQSPSSSPLAPPQQKAAPTTASSTVANASMTSADLEGDRDWIFGNAFERQQELPHFQRIPLWSTLKFSEQTDFFRHLFRGDLEPVLRREVEDELARREEEARRAARLAQEEAEDAADRAGADAEDLEALDAAVTSSVKNSYFASLGETLGSRDGATMSTMSAASDGGRQSVSPPSSFAIQVNNDRTNSSTNNNGGAAAVHVAFSSHYDSDGIFIDRYHPLYKQRKAEKRKQKTLQQQQRERELSPHSTSMQKLPQQQQNADDMTKPKTKEETIKEAAAKYAAEQKKEAAGGSAASRMKMVAPSAHEIVTRSANALSRDWTKIAARVETTKPVPYLTEGDYLAL